MVVQLDRHFCDFLFAYLHTRSLLEKESRKGVCSKRKELAPSGSAVKGKNLLPQGANSFLLEQTPFQKGNPF